MAGRRRHETVEPECGPGTGLGFVPRSPLNSVQIPVNATSGRSSLSANQTTSFFLVSGSAYGFREAVHRDQAPAFRFSQPRQCGDDLLRMLVTGAPPNLEAAAFPNAFALSRVRSQHCEQPGLRSYSRALGGRSVWRTGCAARRRPVWLLC